LEENSFSKPIDEINLGSDGHFVELKTSLKVVSDRQLFSFHKYKTLKWWAQSFLVRKELYHGGLLSNCIRNSVFKFFQNNLTNG